MSGRGQKPARPFLLADPAWAVRRARRRRWIKRSVMGLGLGAAVAVAVIAAWRSSADARRFERAMRADLERLAKVQTQFRAEHGRFASLHELGRTYVPSQGIRIWLDSSEDDRWSATAAHVRTTRVCTATFPSPRSEGSVPSGGQLEIEC